MMQLLSKQAGTALDTIPLMLLRQTISQFVTLWHGTVEVVHRLALKCQAEYPTSSSTTYACSTDLTESSSRLQPIAEGSSKTSHSTILTLWGASRKQSASMPSTAHQIHGVGSP